MDGERRFGAGEPVRARRFDRVHWATAIAALVLATWACAFPRPDLTPAPSTATAAPYASPVASPEPTASAEPALPSPTASLPLPGPWAEDATLTVRGSDAFVRQTNAALELLQTKAPEAYAKILRYVGIIEQGQHSGMWAHENPPRYEVGDATAFASLPWYASTIAHDATHSELYYNYLAEHPGEPVPQEAWAGIESERFSITYQLDVLTRVGGSEFEIEYLAGLTGDHCDLDDDGDCDFDDYNARDW